MTTRTFTVAELEALGLPWSEGGPDSVIAHIEHNADERRWAAVHHIIFRSEDRLWRVEYFEGSTENQESGWGYGTRPTEVTAIEVEAVQVTFTKYQPVKAEAQR
jgi:hypothetical protein